MAETCLLAEAAICHPPLYDELRNVTPRPTETVETVAFAAVAAAAEQGASAILVLSTSGNTARLLSKYRPSVPIITGKHIRFFSLCEPIIDLFISVTRNQQTSRQIHLHRGVYPLWYTEPRGITSQQWQTDVCGVADSYISANRLLFYVLGGQSYSIWTAQCCCVGFDQTRFHDYRCAGLERRSWAYEHVADLVCPD